MYYQIVIINIIMGYNYDWDTIWWTTMNYMPKNFRLSRTFTTVGVSAYAILSQSQF